MADNTFASSETHGNATKEVLLKAASDIPNAISSAASDIWNNPLQAAEHAAKVLTPSIIGGVVLGAITPSRGLSEIGIGAIMTLPMAYNEYERISGAITAANKPGANVDSVAAQLSRGLVSDAGDIGLSFAGGAIGGHLGHRLLTSDTAFGAAAQSSQRSLLNLENTSIKGLAEPVSPLSSPINRAFSTRISQLDAPASEQLNTYFGSFHGHSNFSDGLNTPAENFQSAKNGGMDFYAITDHNHDAARTGVAPGDPRASSEQGIPIIASAPEEYTQTQQQAAQIASDTFTPFVGEEIGTIGHVGGHGHGGHGGHGGGGGGGGNDTPPVVKEPDGQVYTVMNVRQPDGTVHSQVYSLDGTKPPDTAIAKLHTANAQLQPRAALSPTDSRAQAIADAQARDNSHWGGVNHTIILELPNTYIRTIRNTPPQGFSPKTVFSRFFGGAKASEAAASGSPNVLDINDGDMKTMDQQLGSLKDTTGGDPVVIAAHPRFAADWDPNLPPELRGRDYGIKSYGGNVQNWLNGFGKRYVGIEVAKGEALNPNPVSQLKPFDLDPLSYAGYTELGAKMAPMYGRDDHFGIPAERPAGTGVLASSLSKADLLNAVRQRRVFTTTNKELLSGYMKANDAYMGTVFDQAAVNDLRINMKVGGKLDPSAQYKVTLYGDTVGDGKLAAPVQVKQLSGQDLMDTQGSVAFDQVHHTLGTKSAWYVEVQRTDPTTQNVDYLWTAPIWVEPSGAASHSILTRALVGAGTNNVLGIK